jgi:hypothetical protein
VATRTLPFILKAVVYRSRAPAKVVFMAVMLLIIESGLPFDDVSLVDHPVTTSYEVFMLPIEALCVPTTARRRPAARHTICESRRTEESSKFSLDS